MCRARCPQPERCGCTWAVCGDEDRSGEHRGREQQQGLRDEVSRVNSVKEFRVMQKYL